MKKIKLCPLYNKGRSNTPFRPKGKGFVEIAVLRKGEVIGEMAYFDEKQSLRSCSASALGKHKGHRDWFWFFWKSHKKP